MAAKSAARISIPLKRTPFLGFSAIQPTPTTPFLIPSSNFHSQNQSTIKNLDDALKVFDQMLRLKHQLYVGEYNKLLNSIVKMKHYSQVVLLFKRMTLLGCKMNEYSRNIVINCYCRLNQVDSGFAILATFLKRGYAPDSVSMNCLIKGLFLEQKVVEAAELFRKVIREKLCEVNEITNGYCKHKKLDHAWKMFKQLPHKGLKPSASVYATIIQALFSVGRCRDAFELYDEMKLDGFVDDVYTFGIVLDGLLDNGKFEDATLFYHEVDSKGLARHVSFHTSFIHGLCNNNKFEFARSIFDNLSLKGINPDVKAYTAMIQGLCQGGLFQEAEELLDKMLQSGCCPNSVTYKQIVEGCLKHHDSSGSINLLKRIAEMD